MPTVQPSRDAMLTIWSVVWIALGRRIFGIASISSTVANSFMPITVVFSRSRLLRSATIPARSNCSGGDCCCMALFSRIVWRSLARPLCCGDGLLRPRQQRIDTPCKAVGDQPQPFAHADIDELEAIIGDDEVSQQVFPGADLPVHRIGLDRKSGLAKQPDRAR